MLQFSGSERSFVTFQLFAQVFLSVLEKAGLHSFIVLHGYEVGRLARLRTTVTGKPKISSPVILSFYFIVLVYLFSFLVFGISPRRFTAISERSRHVEFREMVLLFWELGVSGVAGLERN